MLFILVGLRAYPKIRSVVRAVRPKRICGGAEGGPPQSY
jgi:hypothetical protein